MKVVMAPLRFTEVSMHRLLRRYALLMSLWVVTGGAAFAGSAGDLGLEFKTVVQGTASPALVVKNTRDVRQLTVTLTDAKGRRQTLRVKNLGKGSHKTLAFRHGEGTAAYKAELEVVWGDDDKDTFTLDFEATRVGKLVMDITSEDVDLDGRTLKARVNNPAASIELSIIGESGNELWSGREAFDPPAPAGTDLALSWDSPAEKILVMHLKIFDIAGYWVGMKITPFSIEIPHDELVFDFGSAAVRADQASKLEVTWGHVEDALKKHGTLLQLKLFIAGFTDTVGDHASNRALSLARAHGIAAWFRKRGLKIPIYYTGFGEEVLKKETPDETEEEANRRAIYILSSHTPVGQDVPRNDWKPL